MTDAEKTSFPELRVSTDDAPEPAHLDFAHHPPRLLIGGLAVVAALVVAAYAGSILARMPMGSVASVAPSSTAAVVQLETRVAALEQKVQAFDEKINDLGARIDKGASASTPAAPPTPDAQATSAAATTQVAAQITAQTAHMQSDVTALSAALAALQAEVKQTSGAATEAQHATQNGLAASIAFIQLQQNAAAGRGFEPDLVALRGVAGNDGVIQQGLSQLETHAAKGAPPLAVLRDEFYGLEPAASVAFAKAKAQDWKDRLMADFKGLVSVKPLHGHPESETFGTVETALASGDIAAAVEGVKALTPETQAVFADWKTKAEARIAIEAALRAIADRFIAEATSSPSTAEAP